MRKPKYYWRIEYDTPGLQLGRVRKGRADTLESAVRSVDRILERLKQDRREHLISNVETVKR